MIILLDLPKLLSHVDVIHPDMGQVEVSSKHGKVALTIVSSNSSRDLVFCKPTCIEWKTMFVLGPLIYKGVEVFSDNWER